MATPMMSADWQAWHAKVALLHVPSFFRAQDLGSYIAMNTSGPLSNDGSVQRVTLAPSTILVVGFAFKSVFVGTGSTGV